MSRIGLSNKGAVGLSVTVLALLIAGLLVWFLYRGGDPLALAADTTSVSQSATRITDERAIELALLHARSWGLEEFTGVRDLGTMKLIDADEVLLQRDPVEGQSSVHQNVVWVVSLDGKYVKCSPPSGEDGTVTCFERENMYVILDAETGRIYSWGSKASPLTITQ